MSICADESFRTTTEGAFMLSNKNRVMWVGTRTTAHVCDCGRTTRKGMLATWRNILMCVPCARSHYAKHNEEA